MTKWHRDSLFAQRREIDRLYPDTGRPSFDDFMKHLLHALEVVGPDHVGIGLDWAGGGGVAGMEGVARIPRIPKALPDAGNKEEDTHTSGRAPSSAYSAPTNPESSLETDDRRDGKKGS